MSDRSMLSAAAKEATQGWLTTMEEIAVACGDRPDNYGIRRAYRACAAGDIPAIKVAGRWRVRWSALQAHFERLEKSAVGE